MKKSELKRKTPLERTPFQRQQPKAKPRSPRPSTRGDVNFSEKVKRMVAQRSGGRCEVGLDGCTGDIEQHHHRRMRSQGGKGTLSNCLGVCHRCHRCIHDKVSWAYRHGLLVRRHREPFEVDVHPRCGIGCAEDHAAQ